MKVVLFYEIDPDVLAAKAPELLPAHRAWWAAHQAAGTLMMVGPVHRPHWRSGRVHEQGRG
jgi:uncharacterized protein YciI